MTDAWGTVTATNPLRVQMDGDTASLPFAPTSLVDPATLRAGSRVRCELSGNRIIIHGRAGGSSRDLRNRLINSAFRTNQRNYASALNVAYGAYTFDRWMIPGRQNLVPNPSVAVDATNWSSAGNGTANGRIATGGPSAALPSFHRVTATGAVVVNQTAIPGSIAYGMYMASVWVRASSSIDVFVDWNGSFGSLARTYVTLAANTWTRIVSPIQYIGSGGPYTATAVRVVKDTGANISGLTLDVTGAMLVKGDKMPAYFDGDSDGCVWGGTRGNSPSNDRPEAQSVVNLCPNPSAETGTANITAAPNTTVTSDTAWAGVGTKSFKITSAASNGDSFMSFGEQAALSALGLQAGHTYTIMATARVGATVRSGATIDGANDLRAGRIVFYAWSGSAFIPIVPIVGVANTSSVASAAIANTANNVQRLQLTFTIPSNATGFYLRLYNGYATGDLWWDGISIIEGTTVYNHFDGATPNAGGYAYGWFGTAGSSSSLRSVDDSLTFTPAPQGQPVTLAARGRLQQIIERINVPAGTYIGAHDGTALMRVYNSGTAPGSRPAFIAGPVVVALDGTDDVIVEFCGPGTIISARLYSGSTDPGPAALPTISEEQLQCARYYQRMTAISTGASIGIGQMVTGTIAYMAMEWPVPPRLNTQHPVYALTVAQVYRPGAVAGDNCSFGGPALAGSPSRTYYQVSTATGSGAGVLTALYPTAVGQYVEADLEMY